MPIRLLGLVVASAVLLTSVSSAAPPASVEVPLTQAGGEGTFRVTDGQWTATVPAGAGSAGRLVMSVSASPTAADGLPGVILGTPVEVGLTDSATLGSDGATLTKTRSQPVPEGQQATLAFFDQAEQSWSPVPTTLSADRRTLTARVSHFSAWTDAVYRGLQNFLGNRADPPNCDGPTPDWVLSTSFLDDQNAPLLWCVGRDPADKSILVVKVSANRGWGFQVTPAVKPQWAYSSLGQELGAQELLTAGLTGDGSLLPGFATPVGSMWLAPGTSAHLGFTEEQVRSFAGSNLVRVQPEPSYVLAGLVYKAVEDATTNKVAAAAFAIVSIIQCIQDVAKAGSTVGKAGALAGCINRDDAAAKLTTDLAVKYTRDAPRDIGRRAVRAFRFVTIVEYGLKLADALGDLALGEVALQLHVFTKPVVRPVTQAELAGLTLPAGHSCEYASDDFKGSVTLRDGEKKGARGGFIKTGKTLLADVDGDGSADGLAALVCSSGASGTSSTLALLTAKSRRTVEVPYQRDAEQLLPGLSVYRIYDMTISGSTLRIRASGHRPGDGTCCPSAEVAITYKLGAGGPSFESARVI